ncbi:hypothetical protein C482_05296 [Natrialba chahannaoensis JCM 10990]|uniref:Pvc16 N-terminal domain-containing protein n=1 Tax=Natrialba chahannaoensis JCM 10990 TaxID=1227492 RepID=M0AVC1_9EURY|nr:DUF4255 domain-containing protein [Natrialba chahannaoensis]ELZ02267.1 hypothetical protein C482_05296 [Natrialba chahannaoensis JCM 10990]
MGSPTAFKELTSLLVDLLRVRLASTEDDDWLDAHQIQPLPPTAIEDDSNVRLGLYLYDVSGQSGRSSDSPAIESGHKIRPPLALDAHYLLTAFPNANAENETTAIYDQHEVLGLAMQALYDNSIIEPEQTPNSLGEQQLTIAHEGQDSTDVLDVWNTFPDVPKQPCAGYRVGPVMIDSTQKTAFERVSDRDVRLESTEDDGPEDRFQP